MIFVRLLQENMGEDPVSTHTTLIDTLLETHTQGSMAHFDEIRCVIRYPDGTDRRLDDEITRYADENLTVYNFDDKINPDYFVIGLHSKNADGHKRVQGILEDIRREPSYRGRIMGMSILGVVTDEPHCIPCAKKNFERGK